jgi:hypothetical protein
MSVFMQPLFTQTIGAGGASSVTFNNIPQGFTDLKVVVSSRGANANFTDVLPFAVNGSFNLSSTWLQGYNTAASSDRYTTAQTYNTYIREPAATATANTFSSTELYFPDYTSGNFKTIVIDDTAENVSSTNYFLRIGAAVYPSTSPITSLTFTISNAAIVQNATFSLYGISNVYDTALPTVPTMGAITDQAGFFSVAFTPAASDQADAYYAYSGASPSSPIYGNASPIVIPVEAQYLYNAGISVGAKNGLGSVSTATAPTVVTANNYASIATFSGAAISGLGQIVFTNIPQNYSHLQIRYIARSSASATIANIYHIFNGDTSNSYTFHDISGNGSSASSSGTSSATNYTLGAQMTGANSTANIYGVGICDILDYSNTSKFKTIKTLGGNDQNGSGTAMMRSGAYMNLLPISSIIVSIDSTFAANSHVALYGIA